jgi:phospholipid-transporting ATPase
MDGQVVIYCKGADSTLLPRLTGPREEPQQVVNALSERGLRTLLFAFRYIPGTEFEGWFAEYLALQRNIYFENEQLNRLKDQVERDLQLLTVVGI